MVLGGIREGQSKLRRGLLGLVQQRLPPSSTVDSALISIIMQHRVAC